MIEQNSLLIGRWQRLCFFLLGAWLLSSILLSFSNIRGALAYPLFVHEADASGDAAYVMADGYASWERLRAASDLYHLKRVPRIIVLDQRESAGYNFIHRRSETHVDRVIDYLALHGVPGDKISKVSVSGPAIFGSLSEARAVARDEKQVKRWVVVTSAPHTRRSGLSFRRSLPDDVRVQVYSATAPMDSAEIHLPIWLEYIKLVVYFFIA